MNEQEQFLKDTEQNTAQVDVLEAPLITDDAAKQESDEGTQGTATATSDDSSDEMKPRNRRERRLLKQLQDEREGSIFLAGKLEARTEAKTAITEEADYLKSIERIYGTDTPEAQLATDLLKKAIVGARDDAENRAYERAKSERENESKEQREAESELDEMVDTIEDEYGVELTESQERAFFQMMQKMSPKDRDGNVTAYADPHAVWEVFSEKLKPGKTDNRAKNMSSRSMTQSGSSTESNLQEDVHARFLRDNGII